MQTDFTVCVLLYGDYPNLAERCLGSLGRELKAGCEFRIGLNDVSAATRRLVNAFTSLSHVRSTVVDSADNIHKYPMMRRLFYDKPLTTPYVMWFDDDSYVAPARGVSAIVRKPKNWLDTVRAAMANADMIGSIYKKQLEGKQAEWIAAQPWYAGQPLPKQVSFATGGWWTIRSELLQRFDWPPPAFDHRGGDVMLGVLCAQQKLRLSKFNAGVAINANDAGVESASLRRGFDSKPIGYHGVAAVSLAQRVVDECMAQEDAKFLAAVTKPLQKTPPKFFNPGL